MSTRKKRFILGLTGGVMALGLAGVIASQNTFKIGIGVHAEDPNNILWKHYAAVEATPIMHGSKEFWANCSELGTHSLTEPTTGRIEEGGDFSATSYFTELDSTDDRYVRYEETTTYYEGWTKEGFIVEAPAAFLDIKSSFFASKASEFGKTDNDGWVMRLGDNSTCGSITLPKTNFHELLSGGKIARTEVGGYNGWTNIQLTAGGKETEIQRNGADEGISCLTRVSLIIYEDASRKVHLNFVDTMQENPCKDAAYFGEIVLKEDEASGNSALKIRTTQPGGTRHYWLGKLRLTNGEKVYKDISAKTGFTAGTATLRTQQETIGSGAAPHNQWVASVHPTNLGVGILGTDDNTIPLTFDTINFNELFESNKGISFTIGAWNGGEYISYKGNNLGKNGPYPVNPSNGYSDGSLLTKESLEYTWKNWQIAINKTGMHVYNVFENTYATFTLTEKQLNGEESLMFNLAKQARGRFFLLTNMVTYAL